MQQTKNVTPSPPPSTNQQLFILFVYYFMDLKNFLIRIDLQIFENTIMN